MSDTPKTVKATVIRDFNDAGTGRSFKAGEIVDLTEGELVNYAAGDLARPVDAKAARPAA